MRNDWFCIVKGCFIYRNDLWKYVIWCFKCDWWRNLVSFRNCVGEGVCFRIGRRFG